jgi:phosphate transport system ATP-binding protein
MMLSREGERSGTVIEYDETNTLFTLPKNKQTEDYVTGRFG